MSSRPFPDDDPRHGSYAGVSAHRRAGTRQCPACEDARRAYDAAHGRITGNPPGRPAIATKAATEDVDEIVIDRHMAGTPCPANTAERLEIVRRWRAQGRPTARLEALVSWNVYRYVRVLRDVA